MSFEELGLESFEPFMLANVFLKLAKLFLKLVKLSSIVNFHYVLSIWPSMFFKTGFMLAKVGWIQVPAEQGSMRGNGPPVLGVGV